jgi:hypothetical protein
MLKESGLASKSLEQATSKIEATELKRTNPLAYYRANPADFLADDLSKRVPASLSPKDRLMLQREGMAVAKEKARLHKNESTK